MFPFFINSQGNNQKQHNQQGQEERMSWPFTTFMPFDNRAPIDYDEVNRNQQHEPKFQPKTQQGQVLRGQIPQLKLQENLYQNVQYHLRENEPNAFRKNVKVEQRSEQEYQRSQSGQQKSKKKKPRNTKKKYDGMYYPNTQINGPGSKDRFLKKNVEYNILNQVFSYVWSEVKSRKVLLRYYKGSEDKTKLFYQYFRILKRGIKRIVNIDILKNFCNFADPHPGFKTLSRRKLYLTILNIEQFSSGVRFLANLYLKKMCPLAILTSKKMRKEIWLRHFRKANEIIDYLFYESNGQMSMEMSEFACKEQVQSYSDS